MAGEISRRKFLRSFGAAGATALLVACAPTQQSASPRPTTAPAGAKPSAPAAAGRPTTAPVAGRPATALRLGYQASIWAAVPIVAENLKLVEEAGGKIEYRRLGSGKEVRDAMIAGSTDVGSVGVTPFIVGAAKGEIVSVAVSAYAGATLALVVAPDAGIAKVEDLKGKKIASQKGSTTEFVWVNGVAPKFGLKSSDYQLVNVTFADHVSALSSKSVDGFAGVSPYPEIAEYRKIGNELVNFGQYDISPNFVAINAPVLDRDPDGVTAFLRGWLATVRLFKEDRQRAVQVVSEDFKRQGYEVPVEVIDKSMSRMDLTPDYSEQLPGYMDQQAKTLIADGNIKAAPDWGKVLRKDFLQKARA